MINLTADECRVLGVLIEKELTTPEQYPLTLNAIVTGCNQKSNRWPVVEFDEDRVADAVKGLREKGLVVQVYLAGSRVAKHRHEALAKLQVNKYQLVILAELLLRGPQTVGEVRGRASRMHNLETVEVVKEMLDALASWPEPLARELPPAPGSRAERYVQLLCPDAHPLDAMPVDAGAGVSTRSLSDRVERLEAQVAVLRDALRKLAGALGEPDPTVGMDEPKANSPS